jgi:hypothetical protein
MASGGTVAEEEAVEEGFDPMGGISEAVPLGETNSRTPKRDTKSYLLA